MSNAKIVIAGFVIGYVLVRLVFVVLAVVAALPGLASLIRGIKAAGLHLQVFTVLTHYTPMFLTAFLVGWIAYRLLGGFKVRLFVALASSWVLVGGYGCLEVADESLLDCWNYSDPVAFMLGVCLVPLGLLVAALGQHPPSLNIQSTRMRKTARRLGRQLLVGAGHFHVRPQRPPPVEFDRL